MIRLVLWFLRLALRWVAVPAAIRWFSMRITRTSVERATVELEETARDRLPEPVARAVLALPAEVRAAGGSAVVAGRVARTAGSSAAATTRGVRLVAGRSRRAGRAVSDRTRGLSTVADDVRAEADASGRRLRSRYAANAVGPDAATDALLDVRASSGGRSAEGAEVDLHQDVPTPVRRGRRRARARRPTPVARMARNYRQPRKPWD